MVGLVVGVTVLIIFSCLTKAQPSVGSGSAMGSGLPMIPVTASCRDAGFTSCCLGRNDSCSSTTSRNFISLPRCYCDAFCLHAASDDCCEDLMTGLLPCGKSVIQYG